MLGSAEAIVTAVDHFGPLYAAVWRDHCARTSLSMPAGCSQSLGWDGYEQVDTSSAPTRSGRLLDSASGAGRVCQRR